MGKKKSVAREKVKTEPGSVVHAQMHTEHRLWFSENACWREDVGMWQRELDATIKQLAAIEKSLHEHQKNLRQHASRIRLHEQLQAEHEQALADYEKGADGKQLIAMARSHQKEAAKQGEHRVAHERLKRLHHGVLARFNLLRKAFAEPVS